MPQRRETKERPLILVTNDDGFESEGLWVAVEAVVELGEVIVVAPDRQWSGAGRSMPPYVTGNVASGRVDIAGHPVAAYAVDASPAMAVVHAVTELASRPLALVISGVNFGANLGSEVTISGTVGAALEASAFGIPALAVSLEMDAAYHLTGHDAADYSATRFFVELFARQLITGALPYDVHAINVNIPSDASPGTSWWLTRLSRRRYFLPQAPDRRNGEGRPGYRIITPAEQVELDSDIWAIMVDRVVSVTPLSLDLTSRVDYGALNAVLRGQLSSYLSGAGSLELLLASPTSFPDPSLRPGPCLCWPESPPSPDGAEAPNTHGRR